jgi:uncharacterized protein
MPSEYETFWTLTRYAVVGDNAKHPFPKLTFRGLKRNGKTAFPVDTSVDSIEGERTFKSLAELPETVDAVVIEVPKEESLRWCQEAVERGIKDIWLHGNTDTPEVHAFAKERGVRLRTGTCAVMYLSHGLSPHTIHGFIRKLKGKY